MEDDLEKKRLMYLEVNDRAGKRFGSDFILFWVFGVGIAFSLPFMHTGELGAALSMIFGGGLGGLIGSRFSRERAKRWDKQAEIVASAYGYNYLGYSRGFEREKFEYLFHDNSKGPIVIDDPEGISPIPVYPIPLHQSESRNWLVTFAERLDKDIDNELMPKLDEILEWTRNLELVQAGSASKVVSGFVGITDVLSIREVRQMSGWEAGSVFEGYYATLRGAERVETATSAAFMMILAAAQIDAKNSRQRLYIQYNDREEVFEQLEIIREYVSTLPASSS